MVKNSCGNIPIVYPNRSSFGVCALMYSLDDATSPLSNKRTEMSITGLYWNLIEQKIQKIVKDDIPNMCKLAFLSKKANNNANRLLIILPK